MAPRFLLTFGVGSVLKRVDQCRSSKDLLSRNLNFVDLVVLGGLEGSGLCLRFWVEAWACLEKSLLWIFCAKSLKVRSLCRISCLSFLNRTLVSPFGHFLEEVLWGVWRMFDSLRKLPDRSAS